MLIYKSDNLIELNQPFGVASEKCAAPKNFKIHCHDFIEIVYISSGKTIHYVDGKPYNAQAGDAVFINFNQSHSFQADSGTTYYNFFIRPEYISHKLADADNIYDIFSFFILDKYFDSESSHVTVASLSSHEIPEMEYAACKMCEEASTKNYGYTLAMDGYMRVVFSKLIKALRHSEYTEFRNNVTGRILEYVDKNYTRNITITELAENCFYNPAYLGRLFKSTFDISLREYIAEKRFNYAKILLKETDCTIESVSNAVGYSDKKQFYNIFKRKQGCTPKQYRDTYAKK